MKRFISGFVTASLIFGITALAASPQVVNIFYNNIKINVFGQEVDTEGNEPFILNDRTYVPARYVAEAMGGKVNWNAETNTIEVVRPNEPEPTKIASDGLMFEYSYALKGYCVPLDDILEKYGLTLVEFENYSVAHLKLGNIPLSVPVENYNPYRISEDNYNKVIIPFLKANQ